MFVVVVGSSITQSVLTEERERERELKGGEEEKEEEEVVCMSDSLPPAGELHPTLPHFPLGPLKDSRTRQGQIPPGHKLSERPETFERTRTSTCSAPRAQLALTEPGTSAIDIMCGARSAGF